MLSWFGEVSICSGPKFYALPIRGLSAFVKAERAFRVCRLPRRLVSKGRPPSFLTRYQFFRVTRILREYFVRAIALKDKSVGAAMKGMRSPK